jgi:hypothetical protein
MPWQYVPDRYVLEKEKPRMFRPLQEVSLGRCVLGRCVPWTMRPGWCVPTLERIQARSIIIQLYGFAWIIPGAAVFAKDTSTFDVQQVLHTQKYGRQFLILMILLTIYILYACTVLSLSFDCILYLFLPIWYLLKANAHFRNRVKEKNLF